MSVLTIDSASGILTVQDMGRPGHLGEGLSRGGAMDRRALLEAAALLGATAPLAALVLERARPLPMDLLARLLGQACAKDQKGAPQGAARPARPARNF